MQPLGLIIAWTVISVVLTSAGALLALSPRLFVKVWRWIAKGSYYIESPEWEKAVVGLSGRLGGYVFVCFGLGGFYLLLRMTHVIK
jgi:hypothetical protein